MSGWEGTGRGGTARDVRGQGGAGRDGAGPVPFRPVPLAAVRPVPSHPISSRFVPPRPFPSLPVLSRPVVSPAAVRGVREKGHAGASARVECARLHTCHFGSGCLQAARGACTGVLAMLSDGEPKYMRPRRLCIGVTRDRGRLISVGGFRECKRER